MMAVRLLQADQRFIQAAGKNWPEVLEAMREAGRQPDGMFGQFAQILIPSFDRSMVVRGRIIGGLRSAQVAVVVERFCLANGRPPASLDELGRFAGRDLPADPFTGKALVYTVKPEGFAVYSVGEDLADDGGPSAGPRQDSGDWGVRVRLQRGPAATSQPSTERGPK